MFSNIHSSHLFMALNGCSLNASNTVLVVLRQFGRIEYVKRRHLYG